VVRACAKNKRREPVIGIHHFGSDSRILESASLQVRHESDKSDCQALFYRALPPPSRQVAVTPQQKSKALIVMRMARKILCAEQIGLNPASMLDIPSVRHRKSCSDRDFKLFRQTDGQTSERKRYDSDKTLTLRLTKHVAKVVRFF
jgi:hypothetical protein